MTKRRHSKEIATIPGKELAIIASPCPVWDAEIEAILRQVKALTLDRTVFPDDRRASRQHFASELRVRVDKLDNGKWTEGGRTIELPEPWPRNETGPSSASWTHEEWLAWINSVTDTTVR